jgi:hypothetical protein
MDYHIKSKDPRLSFFCGDYDALIHTRKPKGIDDKSAYLIGTGIGALAAGCFLVRDAKNRTRPLFRKRSADGLPYQVEGSPPQLLLRRL